MPSLHQFLFSRYHSVVSSRAFSKSYFGDQPRLLNLSKFTAYLKSWPGRSFTYFIEFLDKLNNFKGQALHAKTLEFKHPMNNKLISFDSKLPKDFKNMLNLLENLTS